jgi:hypothetical protein
MKLDVNRLKRWSYNTKASHKKRGIQITATPQEIYYKALRTIGENRGCCPICGEPFTQEHCDPHQLTLEYLGGGDYEVICRKCNEARGLMNRIKSVPRVFCNLDGTRWTGGK